MLEREELTALKNVFAKYDDIIAVYLFGSAAEGRRTSKSDLDLGIVAEDESFAECKLHLLTDLVHAGLDEIDLVILNTADTVTRHEVVRLNKVIYSTLDFDRGQYYSLVVRKYLDLQPYLERQREAYKWRILDGSP